MARGIVLEIKLILCPIDFSEFSVRAYHHALSLAEHYQAKLVTQHVVELWRHPSAGFAASAGLYEEFCQALYENGKKQLQEFVENHTHDEIQPELVVHQGMAPDSILSFAQAQKTDLIVMGTHGRRGFDRLMLGSTTDRVNSFLCGFLGEFRAGFELYDLCDSRVRRRAHPAARVGGGPKSGQNGRGHSGSDGATG